MHRSGALKGLHWAKAVSGFILMTILSGMLLWWVGKGVNRSREHIPTPQEIAAALAKSMSGSGRNNPTVSVQPVVPAPLPKPDFVIQPESGYAQKSQTPGQFIFTAYNKEGADIENLIYSVDYFIAERKKDEPASSVIFHRYIAIHNFTLLPNPDTLLRQNNGFAFSVPGIMGATSDKSWLQMLMTQE